MKHLVTPRLLMRPFSPGDLRDLHALYCDSAETRHGAPLSAEQTLEETKDSLERMMHDFEEDGYGIFAVIERKEKRFIGKCGLRALSGNGLTELTFAFLKSAWGKGYATEAAKEVMRTALGEWGLEKIAAIAHEDDRVAMRVLEKIGMVNSGKHTFNGQEVILYTQEKEKIAVDSLFQSSYRHSTRLSMPAL